MQSTVLAEPVFVGREQELAELERHLILSMEGKGTTVFVSGEAGTGKTRLTKELIKRAKSKNVTVLSGWCLSETTIPYFPFVEAFNAYIASLGENDQPIDSPKLGVGLGDISEIDESRIATWLTGSRLVEETGKPKTFSSIIWKDQTFAAITRILHSISTKEPMILYIEDIHWADSASLALLHYLARAVDNSERVFILATFRSEELTADVEGYPHPLTETLRMMRHEDLFTEIRLSNLKEASVLKMAQNMIGGSLQEEFAQKLATESRGNALFVVESLRMLSERKSLVQEDNKWRLAIDEFGIPSKVRDIILRRLAVLNYAQRRVLDAASVIGEKFDLELLSTMLGLDSLDVLETLNVIAHSTSLICAEGNFYRFDHERSRETLYEELSLPLKKGYHARIAEILESTKSEALPFGDLAYHYAQAENKEKAIKYSLEAGKDALAKYSSSQAMNHFAYVLQTLSKDPQYAEQRDMALEGLGDAFYASNKFKKAVETFEQLANTSTGAVKVPALVKAMFAAFFQGDILHIAELVRKAEEHSGLSRIDRAHILHFKLLTPDDGELERGKLIEESLQIFEEEYALSEAAWMMFLVGNYAVRRGEMEKSLALGLRSIAIYEDLGDFRSQMEALNQTGGVNFGGYALYPEALSMLEKIFEIEHKTKMGNYIMMAGSCMFSAQISYMMGNFAEAVAKGLRALEYLEKAGSDLYLVRIYVGLVMSYVKLGDMSHAEEYLDKVVDLQPEIDYPLYAFYSNLAKAAYYGGKNQWEQSIKHFNRIAAISESGSRSRVMPREAKLDYAWVLEKQGKSEEAKEILRGINKVVEGYAERVKHSSVRLGLMAPINVIAGQTFEARLDIVNVSRANCTIANVQNLFPPKLKVVTIPPDCTIHEDVLKLKDKTLGPFSVKTVTVGLQAPKAGTFNLNPLVAYVDDLGQTKTSTTRTIAITVRPSRPTFQVLPGRITTGYLELDRLLLGGIPKDHAVVLTGSPCDEREMMVKNFLEAGIREDEITFYVSTEAVGLETFLEQPNFYLFLCNPKPKVEVPDLPNIYRLRGKADLTNLSIALSKAYRKISKSAQGKRICVETVSDVLVDYGVKATRKWISELITDLGSKGFTMLAVFDAAIHPPDQANAILHLFDGEIDLFQTEDPPECKKSIQVKRLRNQDYVKSPVCLTKVK